MSLEAIVEEKRLIVCVGPGGVGKTTLAAALGVEGARRGRRALVLTIDPARRLADALGLDGLDDAIRDVPLDGCAGSLRAAMLETRASFDSLMQRIGGDEAATRRIFENRVYRSFSRTLARSHAYVAMERLHDVMTSGHDELVVLDTPPTRSALDILDAPGQLARFLDDDVVRWLLTPPSRGPLSRLLPRGGAAATRLLALLASRRLVDEVTGFFDALLHLREGFVERADRVQQMLRAPTTSVVLVCAADPTTLDDAAYLRSGLEARGVRSDRVVVNRAFVPEATDVRRAVRERGEAPATDASPPGVASELAALRARTARENVRRARAIDGFVEDDPERSLLLPELEHDVCDVDGLLELGRLMVSP